MDRERDHHERDLYDVSDRSQQRARDGRGDDREVSSFGAYDRSRGGYAADADPYSQAGVSASSHRAPAGYGSGYDGGGYPDNGGKGYGGSFNGGGYHDGGKGYGGIGYDADGYRGAGKGYGAAYGGHYGGGSGGGYEAGHFGESGKGYASGKGYGRGSESSSVSAGGQTMSEREILALIEARNNAKMARDFDEADRLRDQLRAAGITVDDKAKTWSSADGRSGEIAGGGGFARGDRKLEDGSMSWENTIYVAGLPHGVTLDEIAQFFGQVRFNTATRDHCLLMHPFWLTYAPIFPNISISVARADQKIEEELQHGRANDPLVQR